MTTKVKARCLWCRRGGFSLRDGKLPRHLRYTADYSGELPPVCPGAGQEPRTFYRRSTDGNVPRETEQSCE